MSKLQELTQKLAAINKKIADYNRKEEGKQIIRQVEEDLNTLFTKEELEASLDEVEAIKTQIQVCKEELGLA
jgi:polyhydroxyalkanoate synthesis regulator phasin